MLVRRSLASSRARRDDRCRPADAPMAGGLEEEARRYAAVIVGRPLDPVPRARRRGLPDAEGAWHGVCERFLRRRLPAFRSLVDSDLDSAVEVLSAHEVLLGATARTPLATVAVECGRPAALRADVADSHEVARSLFQCQCMSLSASHVATIRPCTDGCPYFAKAEGLRLGDGQRLASAGL